MNKDFYTFDAGMVIGNILYFSSNCLNGLYMKDLISGQTSLLAVFPDESKEQFCLHKNCILWKNKLIFLPSFAKHIHIWDIDEQQFTSVSVSSKAEGESYADGCICQDILYLFPIVPETGLFIYDLKNNRSLENLAFQDWCQENINNDDVEKVFTRVCQKSEKMILPVYGTDSIVIYEPMCGKISRRKLPVENIFFIVNYESNGYLAATNNDCNIYFLDMNFNIKNKISCNVEKIDDSRMINNIAVINQKLYVFSAYTGEIFMLDKQHERFVKLDIKKSHIKFYREADALLFRYGIYKNSLLVYPRCFDAMICIDGDKISYIENDFDDVEYKSRYPEHYKDYLKHLYENGEIHIESEIYDLQGFIEAILI